MANIPSPMDRSQVIAVLSDALRDPRRPAGVKTRLIEAHAPEASPEGVGALLDDLAREFAFEVVDQGESMWRLRDDGGEEYVVDALNARFWLVHSTASSRSIDELVRIRMLSDARLDRAWIPGELLAVLPGDRRLVRSSFEPFKLFPRAESPGGNQRVKVRIEGDDPDALLALLRTTPRFATSAALGAVGTYLVLPQLGDAQVVIDYQGRCVSRGSSFEVALDAIWHLFDRYTEFVQQLETRHRLTVTREESGGFALDGQVATLHFPEPVSNLEAFLAALFSCREPFRLWGLYEVTGDEWSANVVDLHVGQPFRLQGSSHEMHVILGAATCGNTLARLIVNLQHHLHAAISLPSQPEVVPG